MAGSIDYESLLAEFQSEQFSQLRPSQNEVLRLYSQSYTDKPDIAIELPTGAGKSLIALLIGEAWRRDGKKVAILTGNKTLARQMEKEAASLGMHSVRMEGPGNQIPSSEKRAYHRSTAIAIMNYWVYFNQNPVIDPADLLFMDDAHLAEHCLHSLFSIEFDRFEHKSLFEALVTELASRFPEYSVLQDALDDQAPNTAQTELFSFLDQSLVADRIREIIDTSPLLESNADLRFRWNRVRNRIEEANLYVSSRTIWLRPYVYPLTCNDHYRNCAQRVYMSATIGHTSDLARRLGTNSIEKIPVPPEHTSTTQGRRLLVMNKIDEGDIPSRSQIAILTALKVHPKSIWLCESRAEAERYKQLVSEWLNANNFIGHSTWLLSNLGDEIDEFKAARAGHLFVGGRFDGMDFKADECHLVILATLPRAINIQEEFFTAYLRDSGFMLRRLNQRIIQALGRCNRSEDDYGIYILADRRFATHFGRESNRTGMPRNIVAEIDCAEDATEIHEEQLVQRVQAFLEGDFSDYDQDLKKHLQGIPVKPDDDNDSVDSSSHEVHGWRELFDSQNYEAAAQHFSQCAGIASTAQLRELTGYFLWLQAKAAFLLGKQGNIPARNEAPDLLEQAIGSGGKSAWFNRLRSSLNRHRSNLGMTTTLAPTDYPFVVIQVFDDLLEKLGKKGTRFQSWVERITHNLESESHDEFQNGLVELGSTLGYSAARPKYRASTDCRWRGIFGNIREVVTFEAKIEHREGVVITPAFVGQSHNQLNRALKEYESKGFIVRGTIVTHLTNIEPSAESSLGIVRIITKEAINGLWKRTVMILSEYRDNWSLEDVDARLTAAETIATKLPPSGWLTRALATDSVWIKDTDLLSEWP
jgi:hypothetical protein